MKVFWSWQSDHDAKCGRYFVRKVLVKVAKALSSELEDAERPDETIQIDHDTKDVAGSPPIAQTILDKIASAAVFVADVTPVATSPRGKRVPNPNVMLELGFALHALGHERIVLVMNTANGATADHLPFDLRHWRHPIEYCLPTDALDASSSSVSTDLAQKLKIALRLSLKKAREDAEREPRAEERLPRLIAVFGNTDDDIVVADGVLEATISQQDNLSEVKDLKTIRGETPLLPLPAEAPVRSISRPQLDLSGASQYLPPRSRTELYNERVEQFYKLYEKYLREMIEYMKLRERIIPVDLKIYNAGTAPAHNIDLYITFPDPIVLYELESLPSPPRPPKPPHKSSGFGSDVIREFVAPTIPDFRRVHEPDANWLNVNQEARIVRLHIDKIKHDFEAGAGRFFCGFPAATDIAPFSASYTISADETAKAAAGELKFNTILADGPPAPMVEAGDTSP